MKLSLCRIVGLCIALIIVPAIGHSVDAGDSGKLILQKKASYEKGLSVPDTLKDKCELETTVVEAVEAFAKHDFYKIDFVDSISPSTPGRALAITISDLSGLSGGVWSGPKHLTIDCTLWQNGRIMATFRATRVAGTAALGSYRGTCEMLERCAKNLGKDVAAWLKNPSINTTVGKLR